jgi:hypothetical protein
MRNHQHVRFRTTRRTAAVAALLVGGVLATAVGVSALTSGDDPASPSPAAAVPAPPEPTLSRRYTSADAAERWTAAAARARLEVCTATPISADALEHCIEGGR